MMYGGRRSAVDRHSERTYKCTYIAGTVLSKALYEVVPSSHGFAVFPRMLILLLCIPRYVWSLPSASGVYELCSEIKNASCDSIHDLHLLVSKHM